MKPEYGRGIHDPLGFPVLRSSKKKLPDFVLKRSTHVRLFADRVHKCNYKIFSNNMFKSEILSFRPNMSISERNKISE